MTDFKNTVYTISFPEDADESLRRLAKVLEGLLPEADVEVKLETGYCYVEIALQEKLSEEVEEEGSKSVMEINEYGTECWYLNGKLHREDGPAVDYISGYKYWYLNGKEVTEEEVMSK